MDCAICDSYPFGASYMGLCYGFLPVPAEMQFADKSEFLPIFDRQLGKDAFSRARR